MEHISIVGQKMGVIELLKRLKEAKDNPITDTIEIVQHLTILSAVIESLDFLEELQRKLIIRERGKQHD